MLTEEELKQREAKLEEQRRQFTADRLRFEVQNVLLGLKVRPEALADASSLLQQSCTPVLGEDGRIASLTIGDSAYDSVEEAAKAFIADRAYLVGDLKPEPRLTVEPPVVAPDISGAFAVKTATPMQKAIKLQGSAEELLEKGYNTYDLVDAGWSTPPR